MPPKDDAPTENVGGFDLTQESGEGWRPKDGDVLVGSVALVASRFSDWTNAFYPLLLITAEDGSTQDGKPIKAGTTIALHAFHTTLATKVLDLQPLPGEKVGVKFHGETQTADGKRSVKLYTFKVAREKGEGPNPYAGLKAPGGKEVKDERKVAKENEPTDAELDAMLS